MFGGGGEGRFITGAGGWRLTATGGGGRLTSAAGGAGRLMFGDGGLGGGWFTIFCDGRRGAFVVAVGEPAGRTVGADGAATGACGKAAVGTPGRDDAPCAPGLGVTVAAGGPLGRGRPAGGVRSTLVAGELPGRLGRVGLGAAGARRGLVGG